MFKKVTKSDLGISYEKFDGEQRAFLEKMCDIVVDVCNKALEGAISADDVETKLKGVNESLKGFDAEKFAEIVKDNETLRETVKNLSEAIEKIKQKGIAPDRFKGIDESIDAMFESDKFKSFESGIYKEARGFEIKGVSLTDNYSGTTHITEQSSDIVTQQRNKTTHVRDFATVLEGDPEYPMYSWQMIYEVNKNARYVAENGRLPESSFKVKEEQTGVKRVGTHINMSKRMLKSRVYVRSLILTIVAEAVLDAEDFGILYGDGSGDNLKGITSYEGVLPVESIISDTIVAGTAGSIKSVGKYGKGIVVELVAPHDLIMDGMKITFTGATINTTLNGTHDVNKMNDTQLYIEDATFAGEETSVNAITYTVNNAGFKSIEAPNSIDALETAVAAMTFAQFAPTFLALNPITINSIRCEKATDGNRLDVVKDIKGNPVIGGLRVLPLTSVAPGKYFLGDLHRGAKIIDYTGLTIDWADDVETKLKNQIVLIAQKELIVPVECPWAFAYGSLNALKSAIIKDAPVTIEPTNPKS